MKYYFNIVAIVITGLILYGGFIPNMVSQNDWFLVAVGAFSGIMSFPMYFYWIKFVFFKKKEKENV